MLETMEVRFWAELKAIVVFSDDEWRWLLLSFEHHYDSTLKTAVDKGGWLYGMNNRRMFSNGECTDVELSQRQLGWMMKSLEMDVLSCSKELYKKLKDIFFKLQEKQNEVNETLNQ
jgi:hypothetical protein